MQTLLGTLVKGTPEILTAATLLQKLFEGRQGKIQEYTPGSLSDLHDPLLLPDLPQAIIRIKRAIADNERIIVFGDYDVDGISGTTLLGRCLKKLGAQVSFRLPHRVDDGYGFKTHHLEGLAKNNVKLVITVDCGTRDIETIQQAKLLGIDCIITDHHHVPEIIPKEAVAIINPKRTDSQYPFSGLSGSGVAFKLAHALYGAYFSKEQAQKEIEALIDFASLGTIADMVPLRDENRIIVQYGLRQLKKSQSPGLRKLAELHQKHDGDTDVVGFHIGPRINASGRIDTPLHAFRMLYHDNNQSIEAGELLETLNTTRKALTAKFTQLAFEAHDPQAAICSYVNAEISHGILGLIAGKLTQQYGKIAFVGTIHNETIVASIRAPKGIDIMEIFHGLEHHFLHFGGHAQAAGCTIHPSELPIVLNTLAGRLKNHVPVAASYTIDGILPGELCTMSIYTELQKLQPYGMDFQKPLFLTEPLSLVSMQFFGKNQEHLEICVKEIPIKIKGFFLAHLGKILQKNLPFQCVGTLELQVFLGKKSCEFFISDIVQEEVEA